MDYTGYKHVGSTGDVPDCFMIPHGLPDFDSQGTRIKTDESGKQLLIFHGDLWSAKPCCQECLEEMHVNNTFPTTLRHLPFGCSLTFVRFTRTQYRCPVCGKTKMQPVEFRSEHHRTTKALEQYAEELLAQGYTNKEVSSITGLGQRAVKDIDKYRLRREYTESNQQDGIVTLKRPTQHTKLLGIDEFKLHDGYKYATHIIDLETGHILWIGHGKGKQVVYDFIDYMGEAWMSHVEAVACDMNSDFQEAFVERCEWIRPVFDYFHIVQNFNNKVVSAVRKDEQQRLMENGDKAGAHALKRTKYILTSNRSTLQRKDQEAEAGKILSPGSELFHLPEVRRHGGYEAKYNALLAENSLLFTVDLVKEQLRAAFAITSESLMAESVMNIIDTCRSTGNKHFQWFAHLLECHLPGIIAHAAFRISSGKIEGINNKIKTLRRQAYGIPDDEYFFLKVVDASHRTYVRNPKSHMVLH